MRIHIEQAHPATAGRQLNAPEPELPELHRVAIVDSCRLFREGVAAILRQSGYEIVANAAGIADALAQAGPAATIDLLILGLDPQDPGPQLADLSMLRDHDAQARTVLLLPACSAEILAFVMLNHVNGVILKDVSGQTLVAILDLVMRGQHVLPLAAAMQIFADLQPMRAASAAAATALSVMPEEPPVVRTEGQATSTATEARGLRTTPQVARNSGLSDRETQILQCLVEGCANKLIARRLSIAEATVKVHIKGLLRKINVSNRTQAAIWALNQSAPARSDRVPIPSGAEAAFDVPARDPASPVEDDVSDVASIYPLALSLMMPGHA